MRWCLCLQKLLRKGGFGQFRTASRDRKGIWRGSLGQPVQRVSPKTVDNSRAICCTLLKRITNSKCVNSEFRSVDIDPTEEVASLGPMAPCRSHHRNHTRQEWISIWSDRNWILKRANQPRSLDQKVSKSCRYVYTPMLSGLRWPGQTVMGSWPPALG